MINTRGNRPAGPGVSRLPLRWAALVVGVFAAGVFGPILFAPAGYAPVGSFHDFFSLNYPAAWIGRQLTSQGNVPTWNPYAFGGMPFLALAERGTLYPANWLHIVWSPERVFCILLVAHAFLSGFGTWLYCRARSFTALAALFAGVVYAGSSSTVLHQFAGHPQIAYSAAWLPFVFWMMDRLLQRPGILAGCGLSITLCAQFFAGTSIFTLLLAYLLPVYVLWVGPPGRPWRRGTFVWLAAAALLALGLTAAQWLPTVEMLNAQQREGGLSGLAATSSYPPVNILTFLVPGFLGDDVRFPYWAESSLSEGTAFCGALTLLLVGLGLVLRRPDRLTACWATLALVVMLLAMGHYSFVSRVAFSWLPRVQQFRDVGMLTVFVTLALGVLAARGFSLVFCDDQPLPQRARRTSQVMLLVAVAVIGCALFESSIDAPPPEWWTSLVTHIRSPGRYTSLPLPSPVPETFLGESYRFSMGRIAYAGLILSIGCLLVLAKQRAPRMAGLGAFVLLSVELTLFAKPYLQTSDAVNRREPSAAVHAVIGNDLTWRFCCVATGDQELSNQFTYAGLCEPGGVETVLLPRYAQFIRAFAGGSPQPQSGLFFPVVHGPLFDLLNVRYYAAPAAAPRIGDTSADRLIRRGVFQRAGQSFDLYENTDALPRAFLVHRARTVEYADSAPLLLPKLRREGVLQGTFVEGELPFALEDVTSEEHTRERCTIEHATATSLRVAASLQKPGLLIVNENWYPGWSATINGQPATVLPANLVMRGVALPAGNHTIEMRFESASFRAGCRISVFTFCLMGVLLTIAFLRRSKSEEDPSATLPVVARTVSPPSLSSIGYYISLTLGFFVAGGWAYLMFAESPLPVGSLASQHVTMGAAGLVCCLLAILFARQLRTINRRRWQAGTLLFAVLFAVTLGLAELTARLFVPAWPALGLHGVEPRVAEQSWGRVAHYSGSVGLNSWGQRDHERTLRPKPGVRRIAFLGDSFLEESTTTPVSVRVEQLLARSGVEVVNLGVSATGPDEYFDRLQRIAVPLGAQHCVVFLYAGNDLVGPDRSLRSWGGVAAVYPRGSWLQSLGLLGVNHLLTNRERPVLQAWLNAGDLRRQEEYRRLVLLEADPAALPELLLSVAALPPEQHARLKDRLSQPEMDRVYAMLKAPDGGQFRSYYLAQALLAAADPQWQWENNSETGALHWLRLAAGVCRSRNVRLSVVIIPEGCQVDSRMAEQWRPLADMRHLTQPCRDAADRLRQQLQSEGIDVLDLHGPLQDIPGTYLNVDGHWSDDGVERVAEILVRHLQSTLGPASKTE